ncbi:MAG: DUF1800 domain-containing protein, partial [Saprospiraceae bacterium]|nr:DUF1800 domain-containing protein [Saprospiraceae bacterium]
MASSPSSAGGFRKDETLFSPPDGLNPYSDNWTYEQAAHLLRRTTFGPLPEEIRHSVDIGLDATLEALLSEGPPPEPPLNFGYPGDPNVPVGESWVEAPYIRDPEVLRYRQVSLRSWTMERLLGERMSIREKMTLFWHNHFAVSEIPDPKYLYRYIHLLRMQSLGNFREIVKQITVDPAMLVFLNGNQNTRQAPNENYARELLELFTIGKGPLAGAGDYTTFTEQDVREISRVLTGWRDQGFYALSEGPVQARFVPRLHDTGPKTLSHRFDYRVIYDQGEYEYQALVDIIFENPEVARFICRKLYRWFVYYHIDEAVEQNVIAPLAQLMIASDYELRPVLRALLGSEHFYDTALRGSMIKDPIDFAISSIKQLQVAFPAQIGPRYLANIGLFQLTRLMQMEYFNPPDVAGWKAYYQEPLYYRIWINASTLNLRSDFMGGLIGEGFRLAGFRLGVEPLVLLQWV